SPRHPRPVSFRPRNPLAYALATDPQYSPGEAPLEWSSRLADDAPRSPQTIVTFPSRQGPTRKTSAPSIHREVPPRAPEEKFPYRGTHRIPAECIPTTARFGCEGRWPSCVAGQSQRYVGLPRRSEPSEQPAP